MKSNVLVLLLRFLLVILIISCKSNTIITHSFHNSFIEYKTYKIILPEQFTSDPEIIHLLKDNTLILVDENNKRILRYRLDGTTISDFNASKNIKRIEDVALDTSGIMYILDGLTNMVFKFSKNGNEILRFPVIDGQMLCTIKNQILVYKTFFNPNNNWSRPVIFMYSGQGKLLDSLGEKPPQPTVGLLPIATGSIRSNDSEILFSHGSDYTVKKYKLYDKSTDIYMKKPSFYKSLTKMNGLNNSEIKKWYRTTLLLDSYFYKKDWIVSYYSRVDREKSWLCFQKSNKIIEFSLPNNIFPIGTNKNNLFFVEEQNVKNNKNENYIIIKDYKVKKEYIQ